MFNIALTGGIASGKTTVGHLFIAKNICVIDTDIIAYDITIKQPDTLQTMVAYFGDGILSADNTLDRRNLATIIFNDNVKKQWLNNLLHPKIYQQLFTSLKQCQSPYSLSLVPLLFETNSQHQFDYVVVVDCDKQTQIQRLKSRNDLGTAEAKLRIQAQATRLQRLSIANDIILNPIHTPLSSLKRDVENLHKKFLRLSANN